MGCYRPLSAYQNPVGGDVSFRERGGDRSLRLPCGRCIGCRLDYALGWSIRCQHEAQLYDQNSFVTLTYDDVSLPTGGTLYYPHVQGFLKRLRRNAKSKVRFFCAAEYGSDSARAHYHLLLFNFDFADKVKAGKRVYRSAHLEKLWPFGHASVGSVSPASAAYVARYSLKKVYGQAATDHYVNPFTGELRRPEFCTMSRRPGLGAAWFEKFQSDVLPCDYVIVEGRKVRVPRFYSKRFESIDPQGYEDVQYRRLLQVKEIPLHDRSPPRMAVCEEVKAAGVKFFHERGL